MASCIIQRVALLGLLAFPPACWPCSVSHLETAAELVKNASVILRVKAVDYAKAPAKPAIWTTGVPDSVIRFQVLEVVKGDAQTELTLHGYLTQVDDFNDQESPYSFVRPGGRGGSCFANSYRQGAEYLLFLQKTPLSTDLTVNWAPLSPVNEELHGHDDAWLFWVRGQAKQVAR